MRLQEAYDQAINCQMALEQKISDLHETIKQSERDFSILQVQLDSARKKIWRQNKLREEAEARSLRHQFIDIYNLEGFRHEYSRFVRELARGMWSSGTIVYFDLDGFKLVNDLLSHDVGNEILVAFGKCLVDACRPEDVAACLHGDEFALILPNAGRKDAEMVMDRIHRAAANINAGELDYKHIFAELGRNQLVAFSSGYHTIERDDPVLSPEDALAKAESMVPKFFEKRTARR
jgi:diguanylate cyclase (GGDEF)-like protein